MKKKLMAISLAAAASLSAQTISFNSGWSLTGTETGFVNMDSFNKDCVKTVWKFANGSWSAYSPDSDIATMISNAGVNTMNSISANEGFWVDTNASCEVTDTLSNTVSSSTQFVENMKVLYYSIENPDTGNEQLLAYDYSSKKAFMVNNNIILGDKLFIYGGVKDGSKEKFTGKEYGLYLDPEQDMETRVYQYTKYGQTFSSTYNFYTDNALMKFDATTPSATETVVSSSNIPDSVKDANVTKLGSEFKVVENLVDVNNSYIKLKAFDSLADTLQKEVEGAKKQTYLTARLGDGKVIAGEPLAIIKGDDLTTNGLLVSYSAPFVPNDINGTYELKKYDASLTTETKIADGEYFFAGQSDEYIYLYKEGSNKFYSLDKDTGSSLVEVSGVTLAGEYNDDTHGQASAHGATESVLDGSSTLSGRNSHLNDGTSAYVAFHYDLHDKAVKAPIFGESGAYKSAQVFKLTGNTGVKMLDNGDGTDESLESADTNDSINGHINLIAVSGDKLYTEIGWFDGNETLGGTCTDSYYGMVPA